MKQKWICVLCVALCFALLACDRTLMVPPTEDSYMETFGTKPEEVSPRIRALYQQALSALRRKDYPSAYGCFEEVYDYLDSAEQLTYFYTIPDQLLYTTVQTSDQMTVGEKLKTWHHYDRDGVMFLEQTLRGDSVEAYTQTVWVDECNKLILEEDKTHTEVYDSNGNLLSKRSVAHNDHGYAISNNVSYIYDAQGVLVSDSGTRSIVSEDNSNTLYIYTGTYRYDDAGRLLCYERSYTWGTLGVYSENYTYDDNGNLIKLVIQQQLEGIQEETVESYTYDEQGNRTNKYRESRGEITIFENWSYSYNAEGQLTKEVITQGVVGDAASEYSFKEYTYDEEGRLIQEKLSIGLTYPTIKLTEYIYGDYLGYDPGTQEGG